jgi:hypothetical protein
MNYATLTADIARICENTFDAVDLEMFARQTEQKVYQTVQIPALRKSTSSALTPNNAFWAVPADYLYVYSLAVVDGQGNYSYLINKDVNFLREAYPSPTAVAAPKYYAQSDAETLMFGPTPNLAYGVVLEYGYYPESIVTASTTWLSENFYPVLLNGCLVEAIRFMKGEADLVALYEKLYNQTLLMLKNFGEGKLRQDAYRSGQVRLPVN